MRVTKLKGPVAVVLDIDTIGTVDRVAAGSGMSRQAVLRQAIVRGLPEVAERWRGFVPNENGERRAVQI